MSPIFFFLFFVAPVVFLFPVQRSFYAVIIEIRLANKIEDEGGI